MSDRGTDLDERGRALIDFERDWGAYVGHKQTAIRARFGISPARYYQLLNRLLDNPEAVGYDPLTVRRLRRRRDERSQRRATRALGEHGGR